MSVQIGSKTNEYDPSTRTWAYDVTPAVAMAKGSDYLVQIRAGVAPARGNLPSAHAFVGRVTTFSPLAFEGLQHEQVSRFASGLALLTFNNPLQADSVRGNITISPKPRHSSEMWMASDGDTRIGINPGWLTPQTTYTITMGTGIRDSFGQTLSAPATVRYKTGDFAPNLWAPDGFNIFPADDDLQLDISAVNVPENRYTRTFRTIAPQEMVYYDSAYPYADGHGPLSDPSTWPSALLAAKKNEVVDVAIPVRTLLHGSTGMLAYGVQARSGPQGNDPYQRYFGLLQLTNLGVFEQWFPSSGVVRVHHLSDGAPVTAAHVDVFISQVDTLSRQAAIPCASGATDASGSFWLQAEDMQRCSVNALRNQAPKLVAIAHENADWAFARNDVWRGAYGYGFDAGWQGSAPESRGTIYSDRQLYQPGETASLTAVAYYLKDGALWQDRDSRYRVTLIGPNDQRTPLGTHTTNSYGTFSLTTTFKPDQPLGDYQLEAKSDSGVILAGDLRIAEFKPPNFKVALNLDKTVAFANDTVNVKGSGAYLFGAPLQGGNVQYYVTRAQTPFTPKGWDAYAFGRQWFWPDQPPSIPSDVVQARGKLDGAGAYSQTVSVPTDLPFPLSYRVDLQVSDVSNLSVADSKSFTALPSDALIGMQGDWVATAGKPATFKIVVTDSNGVPVADRKVRVQLDEMRYSSAAQVIENGETQQYQVRYTSVASAEVASTSQPQTVTLTPPEAGAYRVRANLSGAASDASATDLMLWATGPGEVNWANQDHDHVQIKLDKTTYRAGEMATALVESPYPHAELYFAVVRDKTLFHSITQVSGGAPQVHFRVTPEMVPNAAVEAVLVRRGEPLKHLQPGSLDSLARIGFAPFSLNLDDKQLKVVLSPEHATLQPGAWQTVRLHLRGLDGAPQRGQFGVMVVNESILQLTGYREPDLVKIVYAEQQISTRFADNRPSVVLKQLASPLQKGWGYGGGFLPAAAGTRIRTDFQPLAFYNGTLASDARGDASVRFRVPDDLTTWRIMAVGIGATASARARDMRFGFGDTTFVTTKPLVTNPLLPQFARPGDTFSGGLSVTTGAGASGTLDILGSLNGPLSFIQNSSRAQDAHLTAGATGGAQAYRFDMVAVSAGTGRMTFTTRLGGQSDAFAFPLEIREPRNVMEQVIESGVTGGQTRIPMQIDPRVLDDSGGLHVTLASTLLPEIVVPAESSLEDDSGLILLEAVASRLRMAADLKLLSDRYGRSLGSFNPDVATATSLAEMRTLQTPEGGFVWFPRWRFGADVFVTPYAAASLAAARKAGLPVDPAMVSRVRTYLLQRLQDPGVCEISPTCRARLRLDILWALSDLGTTRDDFLSSIWDERDHFELLGQLRLARYLVRIPGWRSRADALAEQLQKIIDVTGRYATINYPEEWGWLEAPAVMRAEALRLFVARRADREVIDRLTASLLALRHNGKWRDSYETAEALTALLEYGAMEPSPPDFRATASLNGSTLVSTAFQGFRHTLTETQVAMAHLPRNRHDLVLDKSGQGSLHYMVELRYRLPGNRPGILSGLRVTRRVRVANATALLATMGLNAPNDPLTLGAAQVFDIGVEIIADHPVDHVVISDEIPAGLEAVDTKFLTSTPYFQAGADSWEIDYQSIHKDRITAYATRLEAGVYVLHYLVRSVTPGTFLWPPAEAHLQYAPEEFGRSSSSTLIVSGR